MPAAKEKLKEFCEQALRAQINSIHKIGGGRNSRVYSVTTTNNSRYCLKEYFFSNTDKRDRMTVESQAYKKLFHCGCKDIPEVIAVLPQDNIAIYRFITAAQPIPQINAAATVKKIADFIISIQNPECRSIFKDFPAAADAAFSLNDIFADIESRIERFKNITADSYPLAREFTSYFNDKLLKFYQTEKDRVRETYTANNLTQTTPLNQSLRILSPSDIGPHNTIITDNAELKFIDFEYFGWDTPEKCINDFLLHPGFDIPLKSRLLFKEKMVNHLQNDETLSMRIDNTYNLYGIKWCLIILNVFCRNDLERRLFSDSQDTEKLLLLQLEKAQKMLDRLINGDN